MNGRPWRDKGKRQRGIGDHSAVFCVPPTRVCRDFTLYGLILDALVGRKNRKRSAFERGSNAFSDMLKLENAEPNLAFRFSNLLNLEPERAFGSVRFRFEPFSRILPALTLSLTPRTACTPPPTPRTSGPRRSRTPTHSNSNSTNSSSARSEEVDTEEIWDLRRMVELVLDARASRSCQNAVNGIGRVLSGGTRLERIEVDTIELILVSRSNDALEIILLDLCSINQAGGR
ncbi:hypothetical protein B0H14DRAFT_2649361 [Mycena olivaceomarginata]|nr:hypothetical protein B0H14DRAFT_2649361 [Mycena olivaceomarginata]